MRSPMKKTLSAKYFMWILFLLLYCLYATSVWGEWPKDFTTDDEIDNYNGDTYIQTEGTGLLMISAPPDSVYDGKNGVSFPDTLEGALIEHVNVNPDSIKLNNEDPFTENFRTTDRINMERTTALVITARGGGVTIDFAEDNWGPQPLPDSLHRDLTDAEFLNKNDGWVVGGDAGLEPVLLKTTDGGTNWLDWSSRLPSEISGKKLQDLELVDDQVFWAIGDGGAVIKTTDGGDNWQYFPVVVDGNPVDDEISSVSYVSELEGWIVGRRGLLAHTTDGGTSWRQQIQNMFDDLIDIAIEASGEGWVVGSQGRVLKTSNGGEDWITTSAQTSRALHDLDVIYYNDVEYVWITGDGGLIKRTTSGGAVWDDISIDGDENFFSVKFAETNEEFHGWVSGGNGTIYHSSDGGDNWIPQYSGVMHGLNDIDLTRSVGALQQEGLYAWVVGNTGTIIYKPLYNESGVIYSNEVIAEHDTPIHGVTLIADAYLANGVGDITYEVSNDLGVSWTDVIPGVYAPLPDCDDCNNLTWNATLTTADTDTSPDLRELTLVYTHGYDHEGEYESPVYDFATPDQKRRFQNIEWQSDTSVNTTIHLWCDMYVYNEESGEFDIREIDAGTSGQYIFDIDSDISIANKVKYRALLQTSDRDVTPILESVKINAGFLEEARAKTERNISVANLQSWDRVIMYLDEYDESMHDIEVTVLSHNENNIVGLTPIITPDSITINLSSLDPAAEEFQTLGLEVKLSTDSLFSSPKIDYWDIEYLLASSVEFVDPQGNPKEYYDPAVESTICVIVTDYDQQDSVFVDVYDNAVGGDRLEDLVLYEIAPGIFRNCFEFEVGVTVDPNDPVLQTERGRTIIVNYGGNEDSAIIGSGGELTDVEFVDQQGNPKEQYDPAVENTMCVLVTDYTKQDSVIVDVYDNAAGGDRIDNLVLYETTTGKFRGCFEFEVGAAVDLDDPILQTERGRTIIVDYGDKDDSAVIVSGDPTYVGDPQFMVEGYAGFADSIYFNNPLYVQIEDDTTTMVDRTLPAVLYIGDVRQNPSPVIDDLTLELVDSPVPTNSLRRYFRAQVDWDRIETTLNPNVGDIFTLVYRDLNDGDSNATNNDKVDQAEILAELPDDGGLIRYFIGYPNPYKESQELTDPVFELQLRDPADLTLTIFNIAAEQVREVGDDEFYICSSVVNGGSSQCFVWDLNNDSGKAVSSGTYFAVLEAKSTKDNDREVIKLVVVR